MIDTIDTILEEGLDPKDWDAMRRRGHRMVDDLNREILVRLHESGDAVPSGTVLNGRFVLRCAITNHRSRRHDFDLLVGATVRAGGAVLAERALREV